jgi:rhodanese-related sulfurtransferase
MLSINVRDLKLNQEKYLILDVREDFEFEKANIKGSKHMPMTEVINKYHELDQNKAIAVLCHHGYRSAKIVSFLIEKKFANVVNISGGIDAWSKNIDPSVPIY